MPDPGWVCASSCVNQYIAWTRSGPHIAAEGCSDPHTTGRRGSPNKRQRKSSSNCTQGTPAGLPPGIPGIGLEIDGAVQQAPQPERQASGAAVVMPSIFLCQKVPEDLRCVHLLASFVREPACVWVGDRCAS